LRKKIQALDSDCGRQVAELFWVSSANCQAEQQLPPVAELGRYAKGLFLLSFTFLMTGKTDF
jgi:hypothetical protein